MMATVHEFDSAVEQKDTALVTQWRTAQRAFEASCEDLQEAELKLAKRAKEKRKDFDAPFTPDGKMSRSVTINGGEKVGKLNVECDAVFKVQKDLGENAKHSIDAYTQRFRKRMCLQLGEEAVEDVELVTRIADAVSGRAALVAAAVNKLRKIPLTAKHPKALRDAVRSALDSLRPLESRVKVKEVK